jgi:hypothetical protein
MVTGFLWGREACLARGRDGHVVLLRVGHMITHRVRHLPGRTIGGTSAAIVATVAAVLTATVPASAHETGAIHVASSQVPVGGTIDIRGEKLPKSQTIKLELRGILDNYPVGEVRTDTGGAFKAQLAVPPAAPVAQYTLVAIASDGDVTARTDLTIVAAGVAATAGSTTASSAMPGMPGMSGEMATKEMMHIDNTTTTGQWVVIYLLIGLSLAAGIFLLRSSAAPTH